MIYAAIILLFTQSYIIFKLIQLSNDLDKLITFTIMGDTAERLLKNLEPYLEKEETKHE